MNLKPRGQRALVRTRTFRRNRADPGSVGAGHESEGSVENAAGRILELRVVKHVEELKAELQYFRLGDVGIFQERHVEIVDSRTVKEPFVGCAQHPNGFRTERIGIKVR